MHSANFTVFRVAGFLPQATLTEWYNNTITNSGYLPDLLVSWRTGLMHDNTISGTWGNNVWQFGDSSGRPNGSWGAIERI